MSERLKLEMRDHLSYVYRDKATLCIIALKLAEVIHDAVSSITLYIYNYTKSQEVSNINLLLTVLTMATAALTYDDSTSFQQITVFSSVFSSDSHCSYSNLWLPCCSGIKCPHCNIFGKRRRNLSNTLLLRAGNPLLNLACLP